jgi:hydroxylamine dehydrogenase
MKETNWFLGSMMVIGMTLLCGAGSAGAAVSQATNMCIGCHAMVTPGVVADWQKSRHSGITFDEAVKKPGPERRVSAAQAPEGMGGTVVGCAECHTANAAAHKDSFEHNGFTVHVVVTPKDCAGCHPTEIDEYGRNLMANAYTNLKGNAVFQMLMDSVNGGQTFDGAAAHVGAVDPVTETDSCLYCHGTKVEVKELKRKETAMGEMTFPVLTGWPNGGVGRINPDGSAGSCSACHMRHGFSIAVARKPATCSECHKGPDVPAYKVYSVSKHGNLYASLADKWNFDAVPWTVGKDFTAPTCAACHLSLVMTEENEVLVRRTHQMNDRSVWRLFGVVYAHAHPKSPDTTGIKNKAGLPLPTELTGEPVTEYLIDTREQQTRKATMEALCVACHSRQWVDGHFQKIEKAVATTNAMTLTATQVLLKAWETGAAKGLAQNDSIFNEGIEKMWVEQWLFFANSTRFASAMGGADYGVFADGRWYLSKNVQQMVDWLHFLQRTKGK